MKEAVSSPAVASCAGKLFVIGGGPDDDTCSDKVGNGCVQLYHILKHIVMTAEVLLPQITTDYTLKIQVICKTPFFFQSRLFSGLSEQ